MVISSCIGYILVIVHKLYPCIQTNLQVRRSHLKKHFLLHGLEKRKYTSNINLVCIFISKKILSFQCFNLVHFLSTVIVMTLTCVWKLLQSRSAAHIFTELRLCHPVGFDLYGLMCCQSQYTQLNSFVCYPCASQGLMLWQPGPVYEQDHL